MKMTTMDGSLIDTRKQRRYMNHYIRIWRKQLHDFVKEATPERRAQVIRRFMNVQRQMKRQRNYQVRMDREFDKWRNRSNG